MEYGDVTISSPTTVSQEQPLNYVLSISCQRGDIQCLCLEVKGLFEIIGGERIVKPHM